MKTMLTLQIPAEDLSSGRILAATADRQIIRQFCHALLQLRSKKLEEDSRDVFARELARIELEQLRARLQFALGEDPLI